MIQSESYFFNAPKAFAIKSAPIKEGLSTLYFNPKGLRALISQTSAVRYL